MIKELLSEQPQYRGIQFPQSEAEQRRLLRSLMNVRHPKEIGDDFFAVQDEYLQARAEEKGVVSVDELPVTEGIISVWQGDITRLAADAIVNAANSQMLGCFVPMHTCIDNPMLN